MPADMSGPEWLECLGHLAHYYDEIDSMSDDELTENAYRVEVKCPPTNPNYNDRDWRHYRRILRQEMHRRGLKIPTS